MGEVLEIKATIFGNLITSQIRPLEPQPIQVPVLKNYGHFLVLVRWLPT